TSTQRGERDLRRYSGCEARPGGVAGAETLPDPARGGGCILVRGRFEAGTGAGSLTSCRERAETLRTWATTPARAGHSAPQGVGRCPRQYSQLHGFSLDHGPSVTRLLPDVHDLPPEDVERLLEGHQDGCRPILALSPELDRGGVAQERAPDLGLAP